MVLIDENEVDLDAVLDRRFAEYDRHVGEAIAEGLRVAGIGGRGAAETSAVYGRVINDNGNGTAQVLIDGDPTPSDVPTFGTATPGDRIGVIFHGNGGAFATGSGSSSGPSASTGIPLSGLTVMTGAEVSGDDYMEIVDRSATDDPITGGPEGGNKQILISEFAQAVAGGSPSGGWYQNALIVGDQGAHEERDLYDETRWLIPAHGSPYPSINVVQAGSPTILLNAGTIAAGTGSAVFTANDIGKTVYGINGVGPAIPSGTRIIAIGSGGLSATMSKNAVLSVANGAGIGVAVGAFGNPLAAYSDDPTDYKLRTTGLYVGHVVSVENITGRPNIPFYGMAEWIHVDHTWDNFVNSGSQFEGGSNGPRGISHWEGPIRFGSGILREDAWGGPWLATSISYKNRGEDSYPGGLIIGIDRSQFVTTGGDSPLAQGAGTFSVGWLQGDWWNTNVGPEAHGGNVEIGVWTDLMISDYMTAGAISHLNPTVWRWIGIDVQPPLGSGSDGLQKSICIAIGPENVKTIAGASCTAGSAHIRTATVQFALTDLGNSVATQQVGGEGSTLHGMFIIDVDDDLKGCTLNQTFRTGFTNASFDIFLGSRGDYDGGNRTSTANHIGIWNGMTLIQTGRAAFYDDVTFLFGTVDFSGATVTGLGGDGAFDTLRVGSPVITSFAKLNVQQAIHVEMNETQASGLMFVGTKVGNTGNGPFLDVRRSAGTIAAPTAVLSGMSLGGIRWGGSGGNYLPDVDTARIEVVATENFVSGSNPGSQMNFWISPAGTSWSGFTVPQKLWMTLGVVPSATLSDGGDTGAGQSLRSRSMGAVLSYGGLWSLQGAIFGSQPLGTGPGPWTSGMVVSPLGSLSWVTNTNTGAAGVLKPTVDFTNAIVTGLGITGGLGVSGGIVAGSLWVGSGGTRLDGTVTITGTMTFTTTLPPQMGWDYQASNRNTSPVTFAAALTTIVSVGFTATAGRRYMVTVANIIMATTATNTRYNYALYEGATQQSSMMTHFPPVVNDYSSCGSITAILTGLAAGPHTLSLRAVRQSGSGTGTIYGAGGGAYGAQIVILDVGPG